ncbi:hypothetical protein GIB67_031538 [Kingdonia uniflora]|uniref:Transposase MuDR plant domain-containing protein n=1 Tax=Kingdonia uniflora TaxID=39325 RepID=A0A7J7PBC4_9MAGN|nr:hypothetical protein GIB67_031538 [Kingdonia uniflora]
MLTNVPLSIEPELIIGQTETSAEFRFEPQPEQVKDFLNFRFKSVAYTEDPYDFSKKIIIGDLYQDRIELKNHIRAYAVVNKFNLEHVLSNEYKIVVRCKGHKCSWQINATRLVGSAIFKVSTYCSVHTCIRVETESGNAYKAASSGWVASIIKEKLRKYPNYKPSRIVDDMQIYHNIDVTYNLVWRAKEKAHAELYDLICHRYTLIWHFASMVCHFFRYGVAYKNHVESWNNVILKVRDLPIHVFIEELHIIYSEISYTYREEAEKSQARLTPWATDHSDLRVRSPIPIVGSGRPHTQRKRREKILALATKLRIYSRYRKNGDNRRSCKLLPIPSDDNTRPTMALSFTMSTKPPVIPDEDVAISLH